jgi:AcrR family transcriptional regulator
LENIKTGLRKRKSAETKEKIFRSAALLYREYGLDNVSLNSIISYAGVSKGSFYSHYDSKDSLEADFINETIDRMALSYENIFSGEAPASVVFSTLLVRVSHNITEYLGYPLVKTAGLIQIRKSMNHEILMSFNKGLYGAVYKLVSMGVEQGEFKTCDTAEAIAEDIVMTIRGFIFEWIIRYPDMDLNACLQKHFKTYLAGY